MIQLVRTTGCIRTPQLVILVLLILSCALAAGCLDGFRIHEIPQFSFPSSADSGGNLKAYFFDVGQGDSIMVSFNNKTILVDAGETGQGEIVVQKLRSLGITRIDLLAATHPHSDHIGGMNMVLDAFPVGKVLDAGLPHPSPLYERFLDKIEARHISYTQAARGQTFDLDPSLRILVLSPPEQRFSDDLNDNSVVLRISYGTIDILLTGDAGKGAEERMLGTGYALDSEVLKVAHHGSQYSTGTAFLDRIHPQVAVISVGRDNPYGHPADVTLAALKKEGAKIYRTDLDGDILVTSNGATYNLRTVFGGISAPVQVTTLTPFQNHTVTTPTAMQSRYNIVISSTQFNAPGDDRHNLNGEYIRVTNTGALSVYMNRWALSDREGSHVYIFPEFLLMPESSVDVYTGSGMANDTALFMNMTMPVWDNSGDEAILRDAGGNIVDRRSEDGGG